MSTARAEGRGAFLQAFESAITGEDECLARMMRAEGIDTEGMTGRLGQPLAPVGPPLIADVCEGMTPCICGRSFVGSVCICGRSATCAGQHQISRYGADEWRCVCGARYSDAAVQAMKLVETVGGPSIGPAIADAVAEFDTSQGPDFIMGHYRIVPGEPPHEKAQREAKAWARRAERKSKRKRARASRKAGR
jgi:hypothetical protein